jgi:hypothetical protein
MYSFTSYKNNCKSQVHKSSRTVKCITNLSKSFNKRDIILERSERGIQFDTVMRYNEEHQIIPRRFIGWQTESRLCDILKKRIPERGQELETLSKNNEIYLLIPKKIIDSTTQRFLEQSSTAAVLMSCCGAEKNTQIHRRCLEMRRHPKEYNCPDSCPSCKVKINRAIFKESRKSYIEPEDRKQFCDACPHPLGWHPILKKMNK